MLNFVEMYNGLKQGRKYKNINWSNNYIDYIYLKEGEIYVKNSHLNYDNPAEANIFGTSNIYSRDWVEVKPPVQFKNLSAGDSFEYPNRGGYQYQKLELTSFFNRFQISGGIAIREHKLYGFHQDEIVYPT